MEISVSIRYLYICPLFGLNVPQKQIVDQVEIGNDEALAECELYWAHQVRAFVENGGQAQSIKKKIGFS